MKALFEMVLKHEEYISRSINEIVGICVKEKDFTTNSWIQFFVNEQIEEESSAKTILDKLKLVGETNMYLFDRDILGNRLPRAIMRTDRTDADSVSWINRNI